MFTWVTVSAGAGPRLRGAGGMIGAAGAGMAGGAIGTVVWELLGGPAT